MVNAASCASSEKLSICTGTSTGTQCHYTHYLSATNTCTAVATPISKCIKYWDDGFVNTSPTKCKMCTIGNYALTNDSSNNEYECKSGDDGVADCAYPGEYISSSGMPIKYCMGCKENFIGINYSGLVGTATACSQNPEKTCPITNC